MKNLLTFALCILSYALPASTTDSPIACNLGVLSAEQRKQHDALGRKIFSSVLAQRRTLNGYAFKLDRSRISSSEIGEWIAMEERCCPFFDIGFEIEREGRALTLTLGGRAGVREFIESELREIHGNR